MQFPILSCSTFKGLISCPIFEKWNFPITNFKIIFNKTKASLIVINNSMQIFYWLFRTQSTKLKNLRNVKLCTKHYFKNQFSFRTIKRLLFFEFFFITKSRTRFFKLFFLTKIVICLKSVHILISKNNNFDLCVLLNIF